MIKTHSDSETVTITDIQIKNPDLHRTLRSIDPKKRDDFIENCIVVGNQALERSQAVHEVDWIKNQLGEFGSKFSTELQSKIALAASEIQKNQTLLQSQINCTFDMNSRSSQISIFSKNLEGCLKKFEATLDPHEDGPLGQLKSELLESLQELKTEFKANLAAAEATTNAQKKMPGKGVNFEEELLEILSSMAAPRNDSVEPVGSTAGKGACKKGDLVYIDNISRGRIVLEAKDYETQLSPAKIRSGIEEALNNRNADFGIFVVKNRDCLPQAFGAFHMEDKYLVCSVDFLEVAVKFACVELQSQWTSNHDQTVDLAGVQKSLALAKKEIEQLDLLLNSCVYTPHFIVMFIN